MDNQNYELSKEKAFPTVTEWAAGVVPANHDDGMDLRDYFAAKVLEGYISAKAWHPEFYMDFNLPYAEKGYVKDVLPKICYQLADAMMKAREL